MPAETEPRPAFSAYVAEPFEPAKVPFGWVISPSPGGTQPAHYGRGRYGRRGRFDPDEMALNQLRAAMEETLSLEPVWFRLTLAENADPKLVADVRPVFLAKQSDRDALIQQVLGTQDIEAQLRGLADMIRAADSDVIEALRPHLNHQQLRAAEEWFSSLPARRREGAGGGSPGLIVRNRINLEGIWHAVTARSEPDAAKFGELHRAARDLRRERQTLADEAASVVQKENGVRLLRERIEALERKSAESLNPLLSESQLAALDAELSGRADAERRTNRGDTTARAAIPKPNLPAFIYYDPGSRKTRLFDFVKVDPRKGGYKVRFYKDQPLEEMRTINLLFENETAALIEPLAYEVYRRAGLAVEKSWHVRLWIDGQALGCHALVEQPNQSFLRRNGIQDDGNLYKLLWYEHDLVDRHEKKTNLREGHQDLEELVSALERTKGAEQWKVIQKYFDVDQVAGYFAVNTVLSHWDGFFNNYFTYHDVNGTGKWTMYPWDQDQTWGAIGNQLQGFYDMPLTFGMAGDVPPGERRAPRGDRFGFGGRGPSWWRPGGYFSSPLLANPQFRAVFLAKTRQILESVYREDIFFPIIDATAERLRDEVKFRAGLMQIDPRHALAELDQDLDLLRHHVKMRRQFLLSQEELRNAASAK